MWGTPAALARRGFGKGRRTLRAPLGDVGPLSQQKDLSRRDASVLGPALPTAPVERAGPACGTHAFSHWPRGRGTEEATARRGHGQWGGDVGYGSQRSLSGHVSGVCRPGGQDGTVSTPRGQEKQRLEPGLKPGGASSGDEGRGRGSLWAGTVCAKGADTAWGPAGPAGRRPPAWVGAGALLRGAELGHPARVGGEADQVPDPQPWFPRGALSCSSCRGHRHAPKHARTRSLHVWLGTCPLPHPALGGFGKALWGVAGRGAERGSPHPATAW